MPEDIIVVVSLDVEEEGLFRGRYCCRNVTTANTASLPRLEPLLKRGIKPMLFCAYPIFRDPESRNILTSLLPDVEIGAHLHHWNTPPIAANIPASGELASVPAYQAPIDALEAKLENLLDAGQDFLGREITSFRMGRWDLHRSLLPILAKYGIRCDASVRPLHTFTSKDAGPDHFGAPSDPYWLTVNNRKILEVPLTVAPIFGPLAFLPQGTRPGKCIAASLHHWGALALLPVYHPLFLLKITTMLHISNGGRVISLTWHSSEMMPGATPHLPDQASVNAFLGKISRYLDWLERNFNVSYTGMSQLAQSYHPAPEPPAVACDWIWTSDKPEHGYRN